jgi:SAM-dependent methyltransferase
MSSRSSKVQLVTNPAEWEYQERELFDKTYGTETTTPLAKIGFHDTANLAHGKPYMASWTSEINRSFAWLETQLGARFSHYSFIDIGCGKGKVPIVWRLACQARSISPRIIGLDYYPPFIPIARANHQKVFGHPGEFLVADASETDYANFGQALIAYLYNPFDAVILNATLKRLRVIPTILIYNIPTHADQVSQHGFNCVHERTGPNQNQSTKIYCNHPIGSKDSTRS